MQLQSIKFWGDPPLPGRGLLSIAYGCKTAGIPGWHPHQLRHSAATQLRKEFSLDVARAVLGHSSPAVTAIYAEQDLTKAAEAMGRVG